MVFKGRELIAAGYCMYGSASIMVVSVGHGVEGFTLDNTMGEFILTHPDIRIPKDSKQIYSVNEGNSSNWDKAVARFVSECHWPVIFWLNNKQNSFNIKRVFMVDYFSFFLINFYYFLSRQR